MPDHVHMCIAAARCGMTAELESYPESFMANLSYFAPSLGHEHDMVRALQQGLLADEFLVAFPRGKQRVTIGLDLGDRKSKYCVFDGVNYLKEADVPTTPEEMKAVFGARKPCRIAMEVGTHSPWVSAV